MSKYNKNSNGTVSGIVKVELSEIIGYSLEDFLDLLTTRLVDDELLMDIHYKVVGNEGDNVLIEFIGEPLRDL